MGEQCSSQKFMMKHDVGNLDLIIPRQLKLFPNLHATLINAWSGSPACISAGVNGTHAMLD